MAASGEVDLEHQLADAFGLDLCQVVTDLHQDELPLAALGVAGSKFLADEIGHGQKLLIGVSHGRTLLACVETSTRPLPRTSASSADGRPHPARPPTRTRSSAACPSAPAPKPVSCRCRSWPTPQATKQCCSASGRSPRPRARQAVRPDARRHRHDDPEAELVTTGMVEAAEMAAIARAGGVGEMLGHFFDERGRPIENELTERILTQPIDNLRNRRIVAVAGGAVKVAAVRAVLASGLLSGLVTDERTARAIVDADRAQPAGHPKRAAAMAASPCTATANGSRPAPRGPGRPTDRVLEPAQ